MAQGTGSRSQSKTVYQWYLSRSIKADWSTALATCKSFDMKLAEMNEDTHLEVLEGYLTNFHWVHRFYPRGFVGITKPSNSQTWYKASNSEKINFNLKVNENVNEATGKRCLIADVIGYQQSNLFSSTLCNEENFYICEKHEASAFGIL